MAYTCFHDENVTNYLPRFCADLNNNIDAFTTNESIRDYLSEMTCNSHLPLIVVCG